MFQGTLNIFSLLVDAPKPGPGEATSCKGRKSKGDCSVGQEIHGARPGARLDINLDLGRSQRGKFSGEILWEIC